MKSLQEAIADNRARVAQRAAENADQRRRRIIEAAASWIESDARWLAEACAGHDTGETGARILEAVATIRKALA